MNARDFTITPDEILEFENYVESLQDPEFYKQELMIGRRESNHIILNVTRELLQFHKNQFPANYAYITFNDRQFNLKYIVDEASDDYGVRVLLHDRHKLMLHLSQTYTESLKLNSRHPVLRKSMAEMTGYDLYKIAMYVLQDLPKNSL